MNASKRRVRAGPAAAAKAAAKAGESGAGDGLDDAIYKEERMGTVRACSNG